MSRTRNGLGIAAVLVAMFMAGFGPAVVSPQATQNLLPSETIAPPTASPRLNARGGAE